MSQTSNSYTAEKLYEEAYNIHYNWDKILPPNVLEFHNLLSKQTNAPVDLQMGTVLPFVASCVTDPLEYILSNGQVKVED